MRIESALVVRKVRVSLLLVTGKASSDLSSLLLD